MLMLNSISRRAVWAATRRRPTSEAKKAACGTVQESALPLQPTDEEVAAAVSAIHAHLQSLEQIEHVRLTLGMYDKPYRPWRLAGRAEVILGRQALGGRPRNRSL